MLQEEGLQLQKAIQKPKLFYKVIKNFFVVVVSQGVGYLFQCEMLFSSISLVAIPEY